MGDVRFEAALDAVAKASDRSGLIRGLEDQDIIAALASAATRKEDPYLVNVLATEGMNRVQRLAAVASNLAEGVFSIDLEGKVTFVNQAAERLLGRDRSEILGRRADAVFHVDEPAGSCSLLDSEEGREVEEQFRLESGETFPVIATPAPIRRDGEVAGAVVVFRDVRERRRLEAAQRASDARFRAVFEAAGIGIAVVSPDGRIAGANPALRDMLGYSSTEFEWMRLEDFVESSDEPLSAAWGSEGPPHRSRRAEARYIRADGKIVETRTTTTVVPDADGAPSFLLVLVEDVTAQRRAEAARREADLRVVGILDDLDDAFIAVTEDGRIVRANLAAAKLLRRPRRELLGASLWDVLREHPGSPVRSLVDYALEDRQPRRAEMFSPALDAWLELGAYPSPDGGISLYVRDTTSRKRAEERRRAETDALEARLAERTREAARRREALEAFLSIVSHDLRTPLRGIGALAEYLREEARPRLRPEEVRAVDRLVEESRRLERLIHRTLGYARATASELRRERIDLSAIAEDVVAGCRSADPDRTVEVAIAPGLTAHADPVLSRLLLENLLGNAWKFTRERPGATIEVGEVEEAGRRRFYVRDNGVGFPPEDAARLFHPFRRLHGSRFEGLGIGLTTVARIVERHGGECAAQGSPGEGATFAFSLDGGPGVTGEPAGTALPGRPPLAREGSMVNPTNQPSGGHGQPNVDEVIANWPDKPRDTAQEIIERYGPPNEVTSTHLLWHRNGRWKRTVVYRDEIPHKFPKPHTDLLEQTIDYRVPVGKYDELAEFDGSVIPERTAGELTARCDQEKMNLLALNLAHDIVTGERSVDDAREAYTKKAMGAMVGKSDPYVEELQFSIPSGNTPDPDRQTVSDAMMKEARETVSNAAESLKRALSGRGRS